MQKKNALLTFIFSFGPGCGQMYQGYMKRGLSLLFWFIAVIVVAFMLNLGVLGVFAAVVWAYSFFDTFNLRNLSPEQAAALYDDFLPNRVWLEENHLGRLFRQGRGGKILAWVLIAAGVVSLYNNFGLNLMRELFGSSALFWNIYYGIPRFVLAIGVILLGIWMLRRNRPQPPQDDDVVPYTGDGNNA